jgi:predicted nucleic acid-binding protein
MTYFFLDASALAKRYIAETGSDLVDRLLDHAERSRMVALRLNVGEVISVLVRRRNEHAITHAQFLAASTDLRAETVDDRRFSLLSTDEPQIDASWDLIEQHSINATDALLLRCTLNLAAAHRADGDDLVLVAADQRLLAAAQAEGLRTFDPEEDDQATLDALLGLPGAEGNGSSA